MSDFKSKLPDFKELTSMGSKLYKGIKTSVEEIIRDYKQKRAEAEVKEKAEEEVKKTAETPAAQAAVKPEITPETPPVVETAVIPEVPPVAPAETKEVKEEPKDSGETK